MTLPPNSAPQDQILFQTLRESFFTHGTKPSSPKFTFFLAQPGSGKTTCRKMIAKDHPKGELLFEGDGDAMGELHPDYTPLYKNPFMDQRPIRKKMNALCRRLTIEAVMRRAHIVTEGAKWSPYVQMPFCGVIQILGYTVGASCIALNWRKSLFGIINRFEEAKAAGTPARWVSVDYHNALYQGLSSSLDRLEYTCKSPVSVYRRGQEPFALSPIESHNRKVSEILLDEQNRLWSREEKRDHLEQVTNLYDRVNSVTQDRPTWYLGLVGTFLKQAELLVQGKESDALSIAAMNELAAYDPETMVNGRRNTTHWQAKPTPSISY